MTECERIIKEGILPESFFIPETICDFYVDEQRKKIWAIELDLLLRFQEVCEKYGLRFFLIGGTLLGAVRHKGIIPWDDDIDVGMPRADYEKFLKLNKEFQEPFFCKHLIQIRCMHTLMQSYAIQEQHVYPKCFNIIRLIMV